MIFGIANKKKCTLGVMEIVCRVIKKKCIHISMRKIGVTMHS